MSKNRELYVCPVWTGLRHDPEHFPFKRIFVINLRLDVILHLLVFTVQIWPGWIFPLKQDEGHWACKHRREDPPLPVPQTHNTNCFSFFCVYLLLLCFFPFIWFSWLDLINFPNHVSLRGLLFFKLDLNAELLRLPILALSTAELHFCLSHTHTLTHTHTHTHTQASCSTNEDEWRLSMQHRSCTQICKRFYIILMCSPSNVCTVNPAFYISELGLWAAPALQELQVTIFTSAIIETIVKTFCI